MKTSPSRNGSKPKSRLFLPDSERILPNSAEAEQGLLCSAMMEPKILAKCLDNGIGPQDFYLASHQIIFDLLLECWRDNEPVDLITITQILRDRDQIETIGGATYISSLYCYVHTTRHAKQYIDILREKSIQRTVIKEGSEIAALGYEPGEVDAFYQEVQQRVLTIVKKFEGQKTHTRDMAELASRAYHRILDAIEGGALIDMPTGLHKLDYETGGFVAPHITVIAAKPSEGKSACMLNIVEHLAIHHGKHVGIISLEMSDDQLTDRLLNAMAGVNLRELKRTRIMAEDESRAILDATAKLQKASIYIRDDGQLTMAEINATLAAWKAQHGLDIAFIDHAQLCRANQQCNGRAEEVEAVSNALKPMAKRLEIPIVVLSQVTEEGGMYRTKNSRAIEQDADNLWTISPHDENGDTWITISKQRDGDRGVAIPLHFNKYLQRFTPRHIEESAPAKKPQKKAAITARML